MDLKKHSLKEITNFLSSFLLDGRAHISKNVEGSGTRKYLTGSAKEYNRAFDYIADMLAELDPRTTSIYLTEWENALGIPDDCIPIATTDEERQDNIVLKLTSLSIQTEQDFIDLGADFGITITIENNKFPPYDVPFFPFSDYGVHYMWEIAGDFTSDPVKAATFQCLVKLLMPANYDVLFIST